ncbi:unnamed protein product, partial [Musa textilis]
KRVLESQVREISSTSTGRRAAAGTSVKVKQSSVLFYISLTWTTALFLTLDPTLPASASSSIEEPCASLSEARQSFKQSCLLQV